MTAENVRSQIQWRSKIVCYFFQGICAVFSEVLITGPFTLVQCGSKTVSLDDLFFRTSLSVNRSSCITSSFLMSCCLILGWHAPARQRKFGEKLVFNSCFGVTWHLQRCVEVMPRGVGYISPEIVTGRKDDRRTWFKTQESRLSIAWCRIAAYKHWLWRFRRLLRERCSSLEERGFSRSGTQLNIL